VARITERILTLRELNRALLERQFLLRRRRLGTVDAIERLAGLQAQWPKSPYIALWTRVQGFKRDDLTRALDEREVVKATLMRATLHIVSAEDYLHFAAALRGPALQSLATRAQKAAPDFDLVGFAQATLRAAGKGPHRRRDLVPDATGNKVQAWVRWHALKAHGHLLNAPPSAYWKVFGESGPYVTAKSWLGREPGDEHPGRIHLVRRYLAAFGPATTADIASWSGLSRARLEGPLVELDPELRHFRDEKGRAMLDLRRAPLPDPETPAPVRFLPRWDASLLGYAPPERERILPEALRRKVIRNNGDVLQSVLVDGFVAALWTIDRKRGLELEPLRRLTKAERVAIDEEGERLLAFASD
jgi:winged helix DNA-binding protein